MKIRIKCKWNIEQVPDPLEMQDKNVDPSGKNNFSSSSIIFGDLEYFYMHFMLHEFDFILFIPLE